MVSSHCDDSNARTSHDSFDVVMSSTAPDWSWVANLARRLDVDRTEEAATIEVVMLPFLMSERQRTRMVAS